MAKPRPTARLSKRRAGGGWTPPVPPTPAVGSPIGLLLVLTYAA